MRLVRMFPNLVAFLIALLVAAALSGCGGGGSTLPEPDSGAPAITLQPASASTLVGDTVEFSVTATGSAPLNYQWFRNGHPISGATSSVYAIAQASGINANDQYTVTVSNPVVPLGTGSSPATLTVGAVNGIDMVAGCIPPVNPPQSIDGVAQQATFYMPRKVATDAMGNVYVVDRGYGLRKVTPDGSVSSPPISVGDVIAVDAAGNIFTDSGYSVTRISSAGVVATIAGVADSPGDIDGAGAAARFNQISGLTVDAGGNVYVSETSNIVRRISSTGEVSTLAGTAGIAGSADG